MVAGLVLVVCIVAVALGRFGDDQKGIGFVCLIVNRLWCQLRLGFAVWLGSCALRATG